MWPPAGALLAIFGLALAGIFSDNSRTGETDVKTLGASFSRNINRRENPDLFSDLEWNNSELDTAALAESNGQNADFWLAGSNPDLLTSEDWAFQSDAGAPNSGCDAPANNRRRLKRFDERCPAVGEEKKPICETGLYSISLCCLGPKFGEFVIVNRCQPCRYSSQRRPATWLTAFIDGFSIYYCRSPKYIYCCQEYQDGVSFSHFRPLRISCLSRLLAMSMVHSFSSEAKLNKYPN